MSKSKPAWYGHLRTIANACGCSVTSVSKILNGRAEEVTTNEALIKRVKTCAASLIEMDVKTLRQEAYWREEAITMLN